MELADRMELESRYFWKASLAAREAVRARDVVGACESIENLEVLALHGKSEASRKSRLALEGFAEHGDSVVACFARLAMRRLHSARHA